MQVPNKGTQALPPDMRRRQASGEVPNILQEECEAYERLAKHQIDFTPQLTGFKHERQDVNGLVVGSWGLAVFLGEHKMGLQDENDEDFVAAGWIL
ncbi:hypothetical protein CNMCM5623_000041 [Aspergillus felis]|uniref:Uncharacterized protein n=1 Tax=Aspergillus felis TaxID=1287682 RepID=A0A8H6Q387_9EURO|nr:hypothetical protein CNMCM5623_000041 [Aspergillus felis]KAF7177056.1 hypothetical protein CNMCM7691_004704 [Aspergillus felis]